jgi:hypothetical protein
VIALVTTPSGEQALLHLRATVMGVVVRSPVHLEAHLDELIDILLPDHSFLPRLRLSNWLQGRSIPSAAPVRYDTVNVALFSARGNRSAYQDKVHCAA